MPRLVIVLMALLVLLAACGTDDGAVEPIEPILAGPVVFEFDPSGTSGTLAVDTTIPVACSVVYGTDDSFGRIAVDSDMQGGAHDDHQPLLTGLEPDTEYRYRLQGSDAAGTLYQSDIMTFRTPPAAETGLGPNIAPTGTVAGVSSEFSDGFAAVNAIDGDLGSEWSTAGDGDDAWIEIDLGSDREVVAVAFRTRQMSDGSAITDTVTVSVDGVFVAQIPTGSEPTTFETPVSGRVVRFDADQTTGGNTGATEIEIYAAG